MEKGKNDQKGAMVCFNRFKTTVGNIYC